MRVDAIRYLVMGMWSKIKNYLPVRDKEEEPEGAHKMNIFEYFKKKGIDTIDSSFYSKIAMWDSWYRANVKRFHQYRVYHGTGQYERCHRKSLGMAKKICEDISDLLLNERVTITIKDETTAKFVRSVLDAANFTVQGNEYQERKAACGTVAYVPYLTNMEVAEDGSVLSADIKLDYVVAKNIYPTAWENSRITEVIFAFPKTYKRKKYVQLQHHKLEPWQDKDGNDLGYQYVIKNSVVEVFLRRWSRSDACRVERDPVLRGAWLPESRPAPISPSSSSTS